MVCGYVNVIYGYVIVIVVIYIRILWLCDAVCGYVKNVRYMYFVVVIRLDVHSNIQSCVGIDFVTFIGGITLHV